MHRDLYPRRCRANSQPRRQDLEATRLAGFSAAEARRFFGQAPKLSPTIEREYLVPWPAQLAEQRYLDRFAKAVRA